MKISAATAVLAVSTGLGRTPSHFALIEGDQPIEFITSREKVCIYPIPWTVGRKLSCEARTILSIIERRLILKIAPTVLRTADRKYSAHTIHLCCLYAVNGLALGISLRLVMICLQPWCQTRRSKTHENLRIYQWPTQIFDPKVTF